MALGNGSWRRPGTTKRRGSVTRSKVCRATWRGIGSWT